MVRPIEPKKKRIKMFLPKTANVRAVQATENESMFLDSLEQNSKVVPTTAALPAILKALLTMNPE